VSQQSQTNPAAQVPQVFAAVGAVWL
jgi:hypothetical protein